jgi:glyoxylase-like metal-dependent hydrolase (beta-lactamase superfamily II)
MRGWLKVLIVGMAGVVLAIGGLQKSSFAAEGQKESALGAATNALNADGIVTIEYSGAGKWHLFGQSRNPSAPDPEYDLASYTATINYATASKHVVMIRDPAMIVQILRPTAKRETADEYVSGDVSWVVMAPGGPATGLPPANIPEQKNAEERAMEIWATPQGFLRAAAAHNATSRPTKAGTEVTFIDGKHKFIGIINGLNEVERIRTWIDSPVLGDMLCEAVFSDYRDFGGVRFPGRIVRTMGGKTRLDLTVSSVKANLPVDIAAPEPMRVAMSAPVKTTAEPLAKGVYWIRGFQWHSVAIEQSDHIVIVDAPLSEARSLAVMAAAREAIPNKPIKYLINTHAHFDHSGGLRTYVDAGATIITMPINQAYYERIWKNPHAINPDRLELSKKKPKFLPITNGKVVLNDSLRNVEVYHQVGTAHNDGMAIVYLPKEKFLIQVDAWNTEALTAPKPARRNPYMVNLNDNVQRLKLDVALIIPLHGPRTGKMDELGELNKMPE